MLFLIIKNCDLIYSSKQYYYVCVFIIPFTSRETEW